MFSIYDEIDASTIPDREANENVYEYESASSVNVSPVYENTYAEIGPFEEVIKNVHMPMMFDSVNVLSLSS